MIEEVETGRQIPFRILPVAPEDLRSLSDRWKFNWRDEVRNSEVFKLVSVEDTASILGLMSIERKQGYIEVKLLENSPQNVGRGKQFKGIAGSLLASAARLSFQLENDGILMLISKSKLVDHYSKSYGFRLYQKDRKMILDTRASIKLIADHGLEG